MAVNHNKYAILDYETGGLGVNTQPLSIGIVIIDPRRLRPVDNGLFYSMIRPIPDEECANYGLDPVDPKALAVNKLKMEDLMKAPTAKSVWANVASFMKYHNIKGDKWSAPILTGWNTKYDYAITQRMIHGNLGAHKCVEEKFISKKDQKEMTEKELATAYKQIKLMKDPYGFGGETLFRPFPMIDVGQIAFTLFESLRGPEGLKLDTVKAFLGFDSEGAHNALVDCLWTAEIFIRYMSIMRQVAPEIDYLTGGETVLDFEALLKSFS